MNGIARFIRYVLTVISMVSVPGSFGQPSLTGFKKEIIATDKDWLIQETGTTAQLYNNKAGDLIFSNGLIARTFTLKPDGACVGFEHLVTGESFLRSVRPEAEVVIDGHQFPVGGLTGQPIHNYLLPEWIDGMKPIPNAFHLTGYSVEPVTERFPWKRRKEWMPADLPWPPPGKDLEFHYRFGEVPDTGHEIPDYLKKIEINVHYRLYDGIPVISKWISIENHSDRKIVIDRFKSEILAVTEGESSVGVKKHWRLPNMTVESDYEFGGGMSSEASLGKSVWWETDSLYLTQVNYRRMTPCLLECRPQYGPAQEVMPGDTFMSFRIWELLHDRWDRERKGLEQRRMYRMIAPWVTENPVLMHVRKADDSSVKKAIDQCADVGFELVIMTFGSGFNLEDTSVKNLERMKHLAAYAHRKGVALGGYSLLASRHIDPDNDVVMPAGMQPRFGHSPCLQSDWGRNYFEKLYSFYKKTGMDVLEHDGSYPGDVCGSEKHPGHRGLEDSQWKQFAEISTFYRWCRLQGIYLNVPDWYFLNGSNKTGMGYRETNWSLPRAQQEIIERQNIYDGTWEKLPSMGWMFVPLVEYHGGGKTATIEPLHEHLDHYGRRLANLFGAGVQACYRGPELYDAPETRNLVKKWVGFYKTHRQVLDGDIIHIRRPDGRDYDAILHVNPFGEEKGLLMIYNPLNEEIERDLNINMYYTGVKDTVLVAEEDSQPVKRTLSRDHMLTLHVKIPARGHSWYLFR